MTDLRTSDQHRLIQVFLSGNGVFEVYIHVTYKNFSCTCPGFRARMVCKHTAHVRQRYEAGGGSYPTRLRNGAAPVAELGDPVKFRQWVIDNARVEVL